MNKKLYTIDALTFLFGLALLIAAKGFGNLSVESGYMHLKWAFFAALVLFAVISNLFYYRNTDEAEIYIGNFILPLISGLLFAGIYFNPIVVFTDFPNAPMTANLMILAGVFGIFGAHYFYCLGVYLDNLGLLKAGGNPRSKNAPRVFGAIFRRMSPMFYIIGGLMTVVITVKG